MSEVKLINHQEAKQIISQFHYLGQKPFRHSFCCGLFEGDEMIGAIVFHGLSAPETAVGAFGLERKQQKGMFEIGRLVLKPDRNGKNYGSTLVGRAIRALRKETEVRSVITYADSTLHNGAVYQASNFTYCGMTAPKKDFWVDGKIKERGKTKGVNGEWKPRPQKHRYIMIFDKSLCLKWEKLPYPKRPM